MKTDLHNLKITGRKAFSWLVIAILVLVLFILVGVYGFGMKDPISRSIGRVLPLPIATVGSDVVTSREYVGRLDVLKKVNNSFPNAQIQKSVLDKLIEDHVVRALAAKENQVVTPDELQADYSDIQKISDNRDPAEIYGMSSSDFKNSVIKPEAQSVKLSIWLAMNKNLNAQAYTMVDAINQKLQSGQSFESLALESSADPLSAKMGGDLGFISFHDVEPEFYKAIQSVNDKNPHTITTRYGIHIFTVGNKDANGPNGTARYQVRHIFIPTIDFQTWLTGQKQNYSIHKFL